MCALPAVRVCNLSQMNIMLALTFAVACCGTERGGLSFARFWRREFGEFPQLVGRYCNYLLPKQTGGPTQSLIFETLQMIGPHPVLVLEND